MNMGARWLRAAGALVLLLAAPPLAHAQAGQQAPASGARGAAPDSMPADSAGGKKGGKKGKKGGKQVGKKPAISGFVQVFYKGRRDANGDGLTEPGVFRDQRVRIEVRGDVNQHVGYDVAIDPRSPQINGVLRDGFITLDYVPHHEIRVGQQKTIFGYENVVSSTRLYVVNRSEVADNIARGVTLRDIGVGLTGWVPLATHWRLEDGVTIVNGSGMNVQADETSRKDVWGRIGVRYRTRDSTAGKDDAFTMRVGLSAASGDQIEPADPGPPAVAPFTFSFTRYGVDVEVDHPYAFFAAEYATTNDVAPKSLGDVGGSAAGYYVLLAGKTRWHSGPIARWDVLEEFRRLTLGAYVGPPSSDVSLLLNYEIFRDDLGKHDDRYYARLQVRF